MTTKTSRRLLRQLLPLSTVEFPLRRSSLSIHSAQTVRARCAPSRQNAGGVDLAGSIVYGFLNRWTFRKEKSIRAISIAREIGNAQ